MTRSWGSYHPPQNVPQYQSYRPVSSRGHGGSQQHTHLLRLRGGFVFLLHKGQHAAQRGAGQARTGGAGAAATTLARRSTQSTFTFILRFLASNALSCSSGAGRRGAGEQSRAESDDARRPARGVLKPRTARSDALLRAWGRRVGLLPGAEGQLPAASGLGVARARRRHRMCVAAARRAPARGR